MPRTSPLTCNKILGNFFVVFVLMVISFVYFNVINIYGPRYEEPIIKVFLCTFHMSLFMLLWSFFKAMLTDPGIVPPLWGFYMGDSENKRRRYCLMCHVFKPERCHHCSACNRCVLNMDHHCPWINNCVGFYNRKFFMLLLVYVLLSSYQSVFSLSFPVYEKILKVANTRRVDHYDDLILFAAFSLTLLLTITITLFFKFHVRLIMTNSTTIESMDKKNSVKDTYNKGTRANWFQVFGRNKLLWLLPVTGISGKPIGDGVIWTQENVNHADDDVPDNENDMRKSLTLSGTGNIAQILAKENKIQGSPKIGPAPKGFEQFRQAELKKKEESDTKPSSIDSQSFPKYLNRMK
ncbi:hypothetical protein SteCoe_22316 [Stentor coeruleus]|uniref:Palmitoyltransferase n=1 Tax=Stentor coeruleus TaxID=5963 RepID=A0A1R2BMJ2_9CILI|nr:hypothetical protein SteCoe_22316 [Stentor coeruleus]